MLVIGRRAQAEMHDGTTEDDVCPFAEHADQTCDRVEGPLPGAEANGSSRPLPVGRSGRLSGSPLVLLASALQAIQERVEARWCESAARIALVARLLYISVMRSATFPPIRVEPEVRAEVEAVLREGESLTQFIEEAVVAAAAWRRVQSEFITRGEAAIERWKQEGGGHAVDEVMADLQARLDDAKRQAAQREGR